VVHELEPKLIITIMHGQQHIKIKCVFWFSLQPVCDATFLCRCHAIWES